MLVLFLPFQSQLNMEKTNIAVNVLNCLIGTCQYTAAESPLSDSDVYAALTGTVYYATADNSTIRSVEGVSLGQLHAVIAELDG